MSRSNRPNIVLGMAQILWGHVDADATNARVADAKPPTAAMKAAGDLAKAYESANGATLDAMYMDALAVESYMYVPGEPLAYGVSLAKSALGQDVDWQNDFRRVSIDIRIDAENDELEWEICEFSIGSLRSERRNPPLSMETYEVIDGNSIVVGHVEAKWLGDAQTAADRKFGPGHQAFVSSAGKGPTPVGGKLWEGASAQVARHRHAERTPPRRHTRRERENPATEFVKLRVDRGIPETWQAKLGLDYYTVVARGNHGWRWTYSHQPGDMDGMWSGTYETMQDAQQACLDHAGVRANPAGGRQPFYVVRVGRDPKDTYAMAQADVEGLSEVVDLANPDDGDVLEWGMVRASDAGAARLMVPDGGWVAVPKFNRNPARANEYIVVRINRESKDTHAVPAKGHRGIASAVNAAIEVAQPDSGSVIEWGIVKADDAGAARLMVPRGGWTPKGRGY